METHTPKINLVKAPYVKPLVTKDEIRKTKGRFFSILYRKKDGTINKHVLRTGVKVGLKEGGTPRPEIPENITIYSVTRKEWRSFILANILECSIK